MEITDPTLVFLLITLGLVGIGVETLTPGGFIPGLIGIAALVFGIIGAIDIGVAPGGVSLMVLAVALFIAAVALKLYRPLSVAGLIALILSGIFFFDRDQDPTSIPAVIAGCLVLGGFVMFVIERAARAKASPVRYGPEELIGRPAEVRATLDPRGQVFADGALWQAEIVPGSPAVGIGENVIIDSVRGLTLMVSPANAIATEVNPEGDSA